MPQLIGIEGLNEVLNEFLAEFDLTAEFDTDFYYAWEDHKVGYSLMVTDFASRTFQAFVQSLCPQIKCDTFLLSFMHEIGHHHTIDDFSDMEYSRELASKQRINNLLAADDLTILGKEMLFNEYFNLDIEKVATEWAIDYMINNQEKIRSFWDKFTDAIAHFYEINDIKM